MWRRQLERGHQHPLIGQLPGVVHLPARLGRHDGLRESVGLLAAELGARRAGSDAAVSALLELVFVQALRSWYDEHLSHHGVRCWPTCRSVEHCSSFTTTLNAR